MQYTVTTQLIMLAVSCITRTIQDRIVLALSAWLNSRLGFGESEDHGLDDQVPASLVPDPVACLVMRSYNADSHQVITTGSCCDLLTHQDDEAKQHSSAIHPMLYAQIMLPELLRALHSQPFPEFAARFGAICPGPRHLEQVNQMLLFMFTNTWVVFSQSRQPTKQASRDERLIVVQAEPCWYLAFYSNYLYMIRNCATSSSRNPWAAYPATVTTSILVAYCNGLERGRTVAVRLSTVSSQSTYTIFEEVFRSEDFR